MFISYTIETSLFAGTKRQRVVVYLNPNSISILVCCIYVFKIVYTTCPALWSFVFFSISLLQRNLLKLTANFTKLSRGLEVESHLLFTKYRKMLLNISLLKYEIPNHKIDPQVYLIFILGKFYLVKDIIKLFSRF
jgi:hypothetical protein